MIPLVVRVLDEESGETEHFAFIRSPVRIGRGELNDLPLAKPFVSTWHGLVQFDDEGARYVDLRSKNKSYLEDVELEPNTPADLPSGASIVIGTLRLTFSRRPTGEQRAARPATQFAIRTASSVSLRPAPPRRPLRRSDRRRELERGLPRPRRRLLRRRRRSISPRRVQPRRPSRQPRSISTSTTLPIEGHSSISSARYRPFSAA
jgi:hypothetical protein